MQSQKSDYGRIYMAANFAGALIVHFILMIPNIGQWYWQVWAEFLLAITTIPIWSGIVYGALHRSMRKFLTGIILISATTTFTLYLLILSIACLAIEQIHKYGTDIFTITTANIFQQMLQKYWFITCMHILPAIVLGTIITVCYQLKFKNIR